MEHQHHKELRIHHTSPGPLAYWPIAGIYVVSAMAALYTVTIHPSPDYMSQFMGFILILFGAIKLSDVVGFADGFAKYDPFAKVSITYAQSYPFIELLLGTFFLLQIFLLSTSVLTVVVYSASLFGAVQSMRNKEELHCVCLGTYFKLPLSTVTTIEALVMIVMSLLMISMYVLPNTL